jgi:hypothetical protein
MRLRPVLPARLVRRVVVDMTDPLVVVALVRRVPLDMGEVTGLRLAAVIQQLRVRVVHRRIYLTRI